MRPGQAAADIGQTGQEAEEDHDHNHFNRQGQGDGEVNRSMRQYLIKADRSPRINQHLLNVGLPRHRVYFKAGYAKRRYGGIPGPSFWKRSLNELLDIYHEAKKSYRSTMKRLHPDKGGNSDDAAQVARSWSAIDRMYRQRNLL